MYICPETRNPMGLSYVKTLTIDRNKPKNDFSQVLPLVCVSLEGTLFHTINLSQSSEFPEDWLANAVNVEYTEDEKHERVLLIPRPGAAELLVELERHAIPMVYSSQTIAFIEEALLQLSISQGDPDEFSDEEYEKAEAFMDLWVWSRDQCMDVGGRYVKSLGTLSEFSDNGINDIWLIDNQAELVDFTSHVISVSRYKGDPDDNALYELIDRIFT